MQLRKLEEKDGILMLEWMHDKNVVEFMGTNFAAKTIKDCIAFIHASQKTDTDLNLAITNDDDEYMGTVSLKHIDKTDHIAEFAITVRKKAMGKGYANYGMKEMIRIGLEEIDLQKIYWCVSAKNQRAIKFYDKNGFKRITDIPERILEMYSAKQLEEFVWYVAD